MSKYYRDEYIENWSYSAPEIPDNEFIEKILKGKGFNIKYLQCSKSNKITLTNDLNDTATWSMAELRCTYLKIITYNATEKETLDFIKKYPEYFHKIPYPTQEMINFYRVLTL